MQSLANTEGKRSWQSMDSTIVVLPLLKWRHDVMSLAGTIVAPHVTVNLMENNERLGLNWLNITRLLTR